MEGYPRYVTGSHEPFDPVALARDTEEAVCQGGKRKYTGFHAAGVYGGISTGYACGCCLRCVFCWVDWSRDYPEAYGRYYSPQEVFENLVVASDHFRVRKVRVSGGEPTLGMKHLLHLLELIEASDFPLFILETNGILFGVDRDYVRRISRFEKAYVRVSLKAGTPHDYERKTGAKSESFNLPFKALGHLMDYGVNFHVAAMSADPRIMSVEERGALIHRLAEMDPRLISTLEEEVVDPYKTSLKRLEYAGYRLRWPLKRIHPPMSLPQNGMFLRRRIGKYL